MQVTSNVYDFQTGNGQIVARLPCAASAALNSDGTYMLFAVAGNTPSTRATWVRILSSAGGPGASCVTAPPWILLPSAVNGARSPIARSKDDAGDDLGPDVLGAVTPAAGAEAATSPSTSIQAAETSPPGTTTATAAASTDAGAEGPTISVAAAVAGSIGGCIALAVVVLAIVVRKRRMSTTGNGPATLRARIHPDAGIGGATAIRGSSGHRAMEQAWGAVPPLV